jgi:hypothetical protein
MKFETFDYRLMSVIICQQLRFDVILALLITSSYEIGVGLTIFYLDLTSNDCIVLLLTFFIREDGDVSVVNLLYFLVS